MPTSRQMAAIVALSIGTAAVFVVVGGSTAEQVAYLADAGIGPSHTATCHVRLSPACLALARDAGLPFKLYETLRFPVSVRYLPDGGLDITMPPLPAALVGKGCVEVRDWQTCQLDPLELSPDAGALWGAALPFSTSGVVKPCVRARLDAGLPCLRMDDKGGQFSFGDMNVFPRSQAVEPATCEAVECSVNSGDDPASSL